MASIGWWHYEKMAGVCPSVCLSVACLDLTRERKGLGSPKLTGWKHNITRATYIEVKRSKLKITRQINAVADNVSYTQIDGNSRDAKVKMKACSIK